MKNWLKNKLIWLLSKGINDVKPENDNAILFSIGKNKYRGTVNVVSSNEEINRKIAVRAFVNGNYERI